MVPSQSNLLVSHLLKELRHSDHEGLRCRGSGLPSSSKLEPGGIPHLPTPTPDSESVQSDLEVILFILSPLSQG